MVLLCKRFCVKQLLTQFEPVTLLQVIRRIFWTVSRSWNKRISLAELRQSVLLKVRYNTVAGSMDDDNIINDSNTVILVAVLFHYC